MKELEKIINVNGKNEISWKELGKHLADLYYEKYGKEASDDIEDWADDIRTAENNISYDYVATNNFNYEIGSLDLELAEVLEITKFDKDGNIIEEKYYI